MMDRDVANLTLKMVETRNAVRQLLGDRYESHVTLARSVLRGVAKESGLNISVAALKLYKELSDAGCEPTIIIAALVDEAEEPR